MFYERFLSNKTSNIIYFGDNETVKEYILFHGFCQMMTLKLNGIHDSRELYFVIQIYYRVIRWNIFVVDRIIALFYAHSSNKTVQFDSRQLKAYSVFCSRLERTRWLRFTYVFGFDWLPVHPIWFYIRDKTTVTTSYLFVLVLANKLDNENEIYHNDQ